MYLLPAGEPAERRIVMAEERKCSETGCSGDCGSCSKATEHAADDFSAKLNEHSRVRHVIGVVSGKDGVGKTMVTAMLAVLTSRMGHKVGILDADITGPSIPRMFGIGTRAKVCDEGVIPEVTAGGIKTEDFFADSMESKFTKGLYAAGEVLDIDGDCGGFNLQWAWSSGYIAGRSAARD